MATMLHPPADGLAPARFSAEQFLRMGELGAFEDMKVELADGEIVEVSPPGFNHSMMQGRIYSLLLSAVAGTGWLVGVEAGVVLGPRRIRGLDVVVASRAPAGKLLAPMDIIHAVEISDTTLERDLLVKAPEYAQAGIPHYWVVDLPARAVHVFAEPGGTQYARRSIVRFGEPLDVPGAAPVTVD